MKTKDIKILGIVFDNIDSYRDNRFKITLVATDRVSEKKQVYKLYNNIYTQKMIALAGINASGKTSALKLVSMAMSIIIENTSLNDSSLYQYNFLRNGSIMTVYFYCDDKFYKLQSEICLKMNKDSENRWYFNDEWLYCKTKNQIHCKKDIFEFDDSMLLHQRSKMSDDTKAVIKDDDSIVITVTRKSTTEVYQMLPYTDVNLLLTFGDMPISALHVFDSNLEMLSVAEKENGSASYRVRFKNWDNALTLHSPLTLSNIVSSGTIKGQNLLYRIKRCLKSGGYIIVDELENHLNKELVRMITNIFKDEQINKHGACIIFSTHYVELLDFVERKDNIFITRKCLDNVASIEILNYASEVHRNDVKKSEVLLSNYIQGTAPRYEYIKALEDSLCES